ncbi:DUF6629 family protein [Streptomyces sp. NPDC057963]|uniref:DUF6629 family protein n=1 Tax=Streptomyces sp. NPDC057963 TaxID=3346290 RepID=UPI0036E5DF5F
MGRHRQPARGNVRGDPPAAPRDRLTRPPDTATPPAPAGERAATWCAFAAVCSVVLLGWVSRRPMDRR